MSNEIINLETSEPVGMFEALSEGVGKVFNNLGAFFKMCKPILIITIALLLIFVPAALVKGASSFFDIFAGLIVIILGLGLFIYGFWKFLLGCVAVMYLAKDIFENKPIQTYREYMSYIEKFGGQYALFWLILVGIQILYFIGALILGFLTGFLSVSLGAGAFWFFIGIIVLYLTFAVPFFIGTYFSPAFFAFEDKKDPLGRIGHAIRTSYDNWLPMLFYSIILGLVSTLVIIVVSFAATIVCVLLFNSDKMLCGGISAIISNIIGSIVFYFQMFVFTRYYFELIKKK